MTAEFSPATKKTIRLRAKDRCERCTGWDGAEIHHRRPRGMGGSRDPITSSAANGVLLCAWCHRDIESHRLVALDEGWIVRQGRDPSEVLIKYQGSSWAYLTVDGGIDYQ